MRPQGIVAIERIVDSSGKVVSLEKAIRYGWIEPGAECSKNLFVDQGRQLLAYAFAFRSPIQNFVCQNFGVGTGTRPASTTDVALQAPIDLDPPNGVFTAPVNSIDFLSAFVVRIAFTLGLGTANTQGNGSAITEMGLFSGNNTLIARRVRTVAINKSSDFAPTLVWRVRFLLPFLVGCAGLLGWA